VDETFLFKSMSLRESGATEAILYNLKIKNYFSTEIAALTHLHCNERSAVQVSFAHNDI